MLILEVQQGAEVDGTSSTPTGWARMLGYWVVKYEEFDRWCFHRFLQKSTLSADSRYMSANGLSRHPWYAWRWEWDLLWKAEPRLWYYQGRWLRFMISLIKMQYFTEDLTIFCEEREAFHLWRPRLTLGLYTLYTLPPLCYMSHWWSHWSSWWSPWDDPVKEGKTVHNRV